MRSVSESTNSHHNQKSGLAAQDIGLMAVDIIGYPAVAVLVGILMGNILGPI